MVNKCPTKQSLINKYRKVEKERLNLWDKYFGKTPLSNPKQNRGTNNPQDKVKLLSKIKEREKIEALWKKCGYNKE